MFVPGGGLAEADKDVEIGVGGRAEGGRVVLGAGSGTEMGEGGMDGLGCVSSAWGREGVEETGVVEKRVVPDMFRICSVLWGRRSKSVLAVRRTS